MSVDGKCVTVQLLVTDTCGWTVEYNSYNSRW